MSVSSISSSLPPAPPPPKAVNAPPPPQAQGAPPALATVAPAKAQRSADGDYKVANAQSSQVKDKDGDYKPRGAVSAPAQSSGAVQNALSALKVGG